MSNKRIFITGAAGFIGFHLAKHLHQRGDYVIGLDNFNDYYSQKLKRARAAELAKEGLTILEQDICDFDNLKKAVRDSKPTHLVHLAAQAGVRYSIQNPQAYVKSNLEGFVNILEICRHFEQLPLVYASSSSVYGNNHKIPFSVEDRTDHQVSLYGATKKSNELMAASYHHLFNIPCTGLRFFTVYGPWGRPDMAYFSFTKAIMEGKPIEIFNHGKMKRDFTYIDDIVSGTAAAVDRISKDCSLYNLGNHQPESLLDFVEILEAALGKKAEKKFLPMQSGDVETTYADISLSQKELNFYPSTSLKDGLNRFVAWYLTNNTN